MIGKAVSYCEIQGLLLSLSGPGGEGLAMDCGFCEHIGSSSVSSTHHSALGLDGCLCNQAAIPMAPQSQQNHLLILSTERLNQ